MGRGAGWVTVESATPGTGGRPGGERGKTGVPRRARGGTPAPFPIGCLPNICLSSPSMVVRLTMTVPPPSCMPSSSTPGATTESSALQWSGRAGLPNNGYPERCPGSANRASFRRDPKHRIACPGNPVSGAIWCPYTIRAILHREAVFGEGFDTMDRNDSDVYGQHGSRAEESVGEESRDAKKAQSSRAGRLEIRVSTELLDRLRTTAAETVMRQKAIGVPPGP